MKETDDRPKLIGATLAAGRGDRPLLTHVPIRERPAIGVKVGIRLLIGGEEVEL